MAPKPENAILCPNCKKQVCIQTAGVKTYYDPRFDCRFCGYKGKLRYERPT